MAASVLTSRTRDPIPSSAAVAGLETAALDAKRRPPPPRPGLIPRRRLVERLLGSRDVPLALLVAPAGYGKTTLLSQWARRDARPFAWVTLDDGDNDPARLLASIAHALDMIEPIGPEVFEGVTAPPAMVPAVVIPRLSRCLGRWRRPCVLVIDDVHAVRALASQQALTTLVDHLPTGFQLALASRSDPGAPIGRFRAYRQVVELRCPAFAMTPSEGAAMLGEAGLRLDPDQVATLVRRTEGWPAGLYLAALSLRDRRDTAGAVDRFTGDDRLVADYLRQELLSGLAGDELAFLRHTSVLDRLTGPLCDAALERHGSAEILRDLSRSNLLLVPLDSTDEWYRYNALLAGMLRAELRRLEPDLEPALHQRASTWCAEHDDPERAIDHAIAARDVRRAGELLWQNVPCFAPRGRNAGIQGRLDDFTDKQLAGEPALALVAAATHLTTGDGNRLRHWTATAAQGLTDAAPQERTAELEAGVAILRSGTGGDGLGAMRDDARRAYALQRDDGPWRSICCLFEGVACHLLGDRHRARIALQEGVRRGIVAAPSVETLCLAQLALVALDEGDWDGGEAFAERAAGQVERCGIADHPTQALVFAVFALVRARRGRLEDATRGMRQSRRLAALLTDFIPWYDAEVRLALARAAFLLGDVAAARTLLDEAGRFQRQVADPASLAAWLDDARTQVDAAAEALGGGWSLTTAELRVLQLLPSHLSFPEIAERLHVSANTVKTHARAIYRKLQARSRAEAVARARDAALLDGRLAV